MVSWLLFFFVTCHPCSLFTSRLIPADNFATVSSLRRWWFILVNLNFYFWLLQESKAQRKNDLPSGPNIGTAGHLREMVRWGQSGRDEDGVVIWRNVQKPLFLCLLPHTGPKSISILKNIKCNLFYFIFFLLSPVYLLSTYPFWWEPLVVSGYLII